MTMNCDQCKKKPARRYSAKQQQWLCPDCHDEHYKPAEEETDEDDA